MRTTVVNDRAMISSIIKAFLELSTDNTGQMVNAKVVDSVMEDILDQKKFVVRICKARSEMEMVSLFNGVTISDIYSMLADNFQFTALRQTIAMSREIRALKLKIKKKIKKGSKPKKDHERLNKLEKMYKKSIKSFKTVLDIKDVKKDAKPKDKYSAVAKFNKIYSDNDGFYSYLLEDDFDYDDFDYTPEQLDLLGMDYRPSKHRRPTRDDFKINLDDDMDDDLDDEFSEDFDELRDEMNERFDKIDEKFTKIMSGIGKMISVHEGMPGQPVYNEEIIYETDDTDSDIEDRLDRLERILRQIMAVDEEDIPHEPKPVPMPIYRPDCDHPQDDDVAKAMEEMFAGDEPLKVKGVVVNEPEKLSTPEVIDARNSQDGSIDALVESTMNGNQA